MKNEHTLRAEETVAKIITEVESGGMIFQFSIGYSWPEPPTDGDNLAVRKGAVMAVQRVIKEHIEEIMVAARDVGQKYLDEWVDSDMTDVIAEAVTVMEELDALAAEKLAEVPSARLN